MATRRRRIKCGSRSITIGEPNWLTGLATIYVDDIGTGVGFTMDAKATAKVIDELQRVLAEQEEIEALKAIDRETTCRKT